MRITSQFARGIRDNLAVEQHIFCSLGYRTSQMTCIKISTWSLLCPSRVWINAWGWYTNSFQMFNHAELQKDWRSCTAFYFYFFLSSKIKGKQIHVSKARNLPLRFMWHRSQMLLTFLPQLSNWNGAFSFFFFFSRGFAAPFSWRKQNRGYPNNLQIWFLVRVRLFYRSSPPLPPLPNIALCKATAHRSCINFLLLLLRVGYFVVNPRVTSH